MKMTTKKDVLATIALALGAILIVAGIVFLFLSGTSHSGTNGGGVARASTSIAFGADFYTTSAQYAGLAANAMIDLYKAVTIAIGIFFIAIGTLDILVTCAHADITFLTGKKQKATPAVTAENPVEPRASFMNPDDTTEENGV